jgi:hypothetical protein
VSEFAPSQVCLMDPLLEDSWHNGPAGVVGVSQRAVYIRWHGRTG